MRRLILVIGILFAVASALALAAFIMQRYEASQATRRIGPARHPSSVGAIFGNDEALETLRKADRAVAERISPTDRRLGADLAKYRVLAGPNAVPQDLGRSIADVLASPDSYRWNVTVSCIPQYGVRLTFFKGSDRVEVYVCFSCNLLATTRNGKETGGKLFGAARPTLVRAAKELFPDDQVIQRLPEQGSSSDD